IAALPGRAILVSAWVPQDYRPVPAVRRPGRDGQRVGPKQSQACGERRCPGQGMNEHGLLLAFPPTAPAALGEVRGVSSGELTCAYRMSNGAASPASRHRSGGVYRCGVSTRVSSQPALPPPPSPAPRDLGLSMMITLYPDIVRAARHAIPARRGQF